MRVHSFDISEFFESEVDTGALHSEYIAAFGAPFTHVEHRGNAITIHFSVEQTDEVVRPIVEVHRSSFVPFDPHRDV